MTRLVTVLALLLAAASAPAEQAPSRQCFVFWASQCFEIHDARTRDITHHVLITRGPVSLPAGTASCEDAVDRRLSADARADLLDDFNDVLEEVDGCKELKTPPLKAYEDSESALADYRRLTREGSRTRLHEFKAPPLGD